MESSTPDYIMLIASLVLALCFTAWYVIAIRLKQREPLVEFSARERPHWTFPQVIVVLIVYIALEFFGFKVAQSLEVVSGNDISEESAIVAAALTAKIIATPIFLGFLALMAVGRGQDLGLKSRDPLKDIGLGALAFGAIAPFLYGLTAFLSKYIEGQHAIIGLLQEDTRLLQVATLSAVVDAPIIEEFLFRAVLQGWLEKHFPPRIRKAGPTPASISEDEGRVVSAQPAEVSPADSPFRSPERLTQADGSFSEESQQASLSPWPILISSILFAAVHIGAGPAPIPIFFLALVLGYIYQRTHRILPCIVAHMCLNGCSMAVLWFSPEAV